LFISLVGFIDRNLMELGVLREDAHVLDPVRIPSGLFLFLAVLPQAEVMCLLLRR